MTPSDHRFSLTCGINSLSMCGISVGMPRLHELSLTAPLAHQHVSFCCLHHWQGCSLGHIVWIWQLSAPRHLSQRCSASPTCGRPGCEPHTRPSGRMELLEQMERRRKLKVTDVCQGGWHWRCPRHVVILITLKLVAFFFVFRSYLLFLSQWSACKCKIQCRKYGVTSQMLIYAICCFILNMAAL